MMERTQRINSYVGRLVRLSRHVETCGGTVYAVGRVFRLYTHWRGKVSLEAPSGKACPRPRPFIGHVPFCDFELVKDGATGFCRVCGCIDDQACPGGCSWADSEQTLCTRCEEHVGNSHAD